MNSQPPATRDSDNNGQKRQEDRAPGVPLRIVGMLILVALFVWHDPKTTTDWHDALVVALAALAGYWLTGSALAIALTVAAMCAAALTNGQWHAVSTQVWLWCGIAAGGAAALYILGQRYRQAMLLNRARRAKAQQDDS